MAARLTIDPDRPEFDRPIVILEDRRLPGRDLEISDDEDEEINEADTKPVEIVQDTSTAKPPRKSSLLVDTSTRPQARKRSVTFEPVDVETVVAAHEKQHSHELHEEENDEVESYDDQDEIFKMPEKSLSVPISIETLRLRVCEEIPDTPPPRGNKRMSEPRPPTPPGASHRVKYPKTPPSTPMDANYM